MIFFWTNQHNDRTSQQKDLTSRHYYLTSRHNYLTSQHNYLTSRHKYLTSRHNYLTSDGRNMPPYIGKKVHSIMVCLALLPFSLFVNDTEEKDLGSETIRFSNVIEYRFLLLFYLQVWCYPGMRNTHSKICCHSQHTASYSVLFFRS